MLSLSACAPQVQAAKYTADTIKDNVYETSHQIKQWVMTPPPKPLPNAVGTSYCYRTVQDILCYRQPMPGWENRLVAYQGTYANEPAPAVMKLLPKPANDPGTSPANRVANSKPVFTAMPVSAKEEERPSTDQPQVIDATHEQLPDPALAPQL